MYYFAHDCKSNHHQWQAVISNRHPSTNHQVNPNPTAPPRKNWQGLYPSGGPFNLQPFFLKGVKKWFEKYGSRNLVLEIWFEKSGSKNLVREKWLEKSGWPEKKVVLNYKSTFFLVQEKWLTRKRKSELQNHFSRATFLHFSRKVVAD